MQDYRKFMSETVALISTKIDNGFELTGDAVIGDVKLGKTFYKDDYTTKLVGTSVAVDTSDADAVAGDIAEGKIAYVKGVKIVGLAGIAEYALTIDTSGDGTGSVTVGGDAYSEPINFKAGTEVELVATAGEGSVFVNWTVDAVEVSTEAEFTYPMETEAVTIVANFDIEEEG